MDTEAARTTSWVTLHSKTSADRLYSSLREGLSVEEIGWRFGPLATRETLGITGRLRQLYDMQLWLARLL